MLLRVLMVDSDPIVADAATKLLEARGYKARAAYSAEHAILVAGDLQPHVLLSDAVLPGMDGADLAAWFREHMPSCKVVLISFNPSIAGRVEEAMRGGNVHEFISKKDGLGKILTFLSAITPEQ